MKLEQIISISRPRFWLYTFGPVLIALAASSKTQPLIPLITLVLYFTFPANLLIYGLNDIYDYETDKHNPKKSGYEKLLSKDKHQTLNKLIIWVGVAPLALLIAFGNLPIQSYIFLAGFWFFGSFYSAPPIRAKTKPILDSAFNILYAMPGFAVYGLLSSRFPHMQIVLASMLWCMAMHAFSAVPDIAADKKAGLRTIATLLGRKGTILFCLSAYLASAALTFVYLGWFSVLAGAIYGVIMLLSLTKKDAELFRVYTYFPYINMLVGAGLFFVVALL